MCRVAAQRDSWHAFDILCLSPCLGDWGCGRQYKKGSLSAYIVCMSAVYMLLLWKALSLGLSIYIFINHHSHWEGGIEESFKCKLTLCLRTTHTHTGWQSPTALFTVYLPCLQLPAPNTHTTCSSDCLPGKRDSGQLIFSSTHRLINTPHYSRSHVKQPKQARQTSYDPCRFLFLQTCLNS